MKSLIDRALNLTEVQGARYADVRVMHREAESVTVKNGSVEELSHNHSQGFSVRALVDGAWGFAASSILTSAEVDRVTALAVSIARASALVKRQDIRLDSLRPIVGRYRTPTQIDPFQVPMGSKIDMLLAADAAMHKVKGIRTAKSTAEASKEIKTFASSEGSFIEQEIIVTGGGIQCVAAALDEVQGRSYPNRFGRDRRTAGWEWVAGLDLPGNGERLATEAVQLLTAPQCPATTTTVILGGAQLALNVHECFGHAVELDRILGSEAGYAGTSFLSVRDLGIFQLGSEHVNVVADATMPEGLGTFGYDDEGIPAQRVPIIQNGILVNFLTGRDTAAKLGQASTGAARADGWACMPLIRMTNINLEPGVWEWEDLLADTDEGIYMDLCRSLSIDNKRLNFQFGTETAYEIKGGKLGRMFKNATYTGITPQFWASCNAVCNAKHWSIWGTDCGKGQPKQNANVGHGTAPARFCNVCVGVMR